MPPFAPLSARSTQPASGTLSTPPPAAPVEVCAEPQLHTASSSTPRAALFAPMCSANAQSDSDVIPPAEAAGFSPLPSQVFPAVEPLSTPPTKELQAQVPRAPPPRLPLSRLFTLDSPVASLALTADDANTDCEQQRTNQHTSCCVASVQPAAMSHSRPVAAQPLPLHGTAFLPPQSLIAAELELTSTFPL